MRYLVCKVDHENIEREKFKNPYSITGPRVWHETFEIAKLEAERLCLKENQEFAIFAEIGRIKPAPKTIFENCTL